MRVFKTRLFDRWAQKEKLTDECLQQAIREIEAGLVDAALGAHVYKKRIAGRGRGKRGGVRSILIYQSGEKAFFIFGYAKNEKDDITSEEKKIARALSHELLGYSVEKLSQLVKNEELIEVNYGR